MIVVLGNRLESASIHPELRGRVDVGIDLFRDLDEEYLICSGGRTNEEVPLAECDVMATYAIDQGIGSDRILRDDAALDTIGNGYFTRVLVEELDREVKTIYVATSCYHVERTKFVFEQCFGPGYDIRLPTCFDSEIAEEDLHESASLAEARELFAPVEPGDLAAIRNRLIEEHPYYDWLKRE